MRRALIFDCDGVLVDSEQRGHLFAFNEMWRALGVTWQWTHEQYKQKLTISGGRERLSSLRHDAEFRTQVDIFDDDTWNDTVDHWHQVKTAIYIDMVERGEIADRPGARDLAQEAINAGWTIAVASSGARRSVEAVVTRVLGPELTAWTHIVTGEDVRTKKPAPDVYLCTATDIGVAPSRCVVIEDSVAGLTSALQAGMICVVTPTPASIELAFPGAAAVLSALASTSSDCMRVLANEAGLVFGAKLDLDGLEKLVPVKGMPYTSDGMRIAQTQSLLERR